MLAQKHSESIALIIHLALGKRLEAPASGNDRLHEDDEHAMIFNSGDMSNLTLPDPCETKPRCVVDAKLKFQAGKKGTTTNQNSG